MDQASFKLLGLPQAQKRIKKVKDAVTYRKKANAQALAVVDRWVQKNFQGEGGNVGGWAPLQAQTIKARTRNKGKVKILQDVGWLRKKWKYDYSNTHAALVSGVNYGKFHDEGTQHLPVRQIVPKKPEIWPEIEKVFALHLRKAIHL